MRYIWDEQARDFVPIDQYRQPVKHARSDFPAPAVWGDLPPYKSPLGTGVIDGRRARREDMARGGCREVDPSERPPIEPKSRKQAEAEQRSLDSRPRYIMPEATKQRLMGGK